MTKETFVFVLLGTVAMFLVALICRKNFALSYLKTVFLSLLLTVSGVAGVMLMFFLENGRFGGVSFFGAVFLVPLFLFPFSRLLKIRYLDYLDLAAPMVCIMLSVMKINCYHAGCCAGMILRYEGTTPVRFPSQLVELGVALVIGIGLIALIKGRFLRGAAYPVFMILYGFTRFALNLLRETSEAFFGLPFGNLWAILSAALGVVWLVLYFVWARKKKSSRS